MMNAKRTLALAVAAACSTPMLASATNGDSLIGLGAQSRALGGTGTAAFYGSENALSNPALLGKAKGSEFAFGGTVFMPNVKARSNVASAPGTSTSETSEADLSVIPEVSSYTRISDTLVFGIGMYGTAGMGVDYRDNDELFNGYTNLQLMKFAPTLAYSQDKFGFGVSPVIQYGALDINFNDNYNSDPTDPTSVGNGVSTDLGFGYTLGMYYDVNEQLTVGLAYQSPIDMEYEKQITRAADAFGIGPNGMGTITSDHLEQPAEFKVGVAYTMDSYLFTADYKRIGWGSAKGYKDFNWDDQDVLGLGVKYSGGGFWVGAGYNRGEDPIGVLGSAQNMQGYSNQAVNLFNNHFFPAVVEDHYTIGGGIALNKTMTLEGAVVMAAETSKTVDTGTISAVMGPAQDPAALPTNATTHKVTHSQMAYTISFRMNF